MIHIICALDCEAAPLISRYKMKHDATSQSLKTYLSKNGDISVSISGVGSSRSATTVEKVKAYYSSKKQDVWLNVGIAGHRDIDIGDIRLAQTIIDADTGSKWYPQILFDTAIPSTDLITLNKPSSSYTDAMFDMEAAGFYSSAIKHSTAELVHSLKVISDNEAHPPEQLNKAKITILIENQIEAINQVIIRLTALSDEITIDNGMSDYFETLCAQWHFSQYQRHRLALVLNRWACIKPGQTPLNIINKNITDSNQVLDCLEEHMDTATLVFHV